jgi:hypothetical protein
MRLRFPKGEADGSFCIEVTLRVGSGDPAALADRVTLWLEKWVNANRFWRTSLYAPEETLDFLDEFAEVPTCVVGTSSSLNLRLKCRPEAKKRWKDWLVLRLIKELLLAFKEVTSVEKISDCSG